MSNSSGYHMVYQKKVRGTDVLMIYYGKRHLRAGRIGNLKENPKKVLSRTWNPYNSNWK